MSNRTNCLLIRVIGAAVIVGAALGLGASAARADQPAPSAATCPPPATAMTLDQAIAQAENLGATSTDVSTILVPFWSTTDKNGDGILCQAKDSLGRHPNLPPWFANYVDNNAYGQSN